MTQARKKEVLSLVCDPISFAQEYLEEDGSRVEPKWYIPIVPMVLVNGAHGIGTGWSTDVPCYNPVDVIDWLEGRIQGTATSSLLRPWFRGFKGTVVAEGPGKFSVYGLSTIEADKGVVRITELPPGVWTQDYKEFLQTAATSTAVAARGSASQTTAGSSSTTGSKPVKTIAIQSITENNTDTTVDFTITFDTKCMEKVTFAATSRPSPDALACILKGIQRRTRFFLFCRDVPRASCRKT
jgi:DNA topoisomerase-2